MSNKFYVTTTLPYINAEPHLGFAAEIVRADCLARYARMQGKEVIFNTGTDEHGLKIFRKAEDAGINTLEYCDSYAEKFKKLRESLNLTYNSFSRTTSPEHIKAAQEFWKRCEANGDIYKKKYKTKYCVGCELELTDSDLVDGRCPYHANQDLEIIEEENYFFRWSKYADKLLDLYKVKTDFVLPPGRLNEIKSFIEGGLNDFSISRLKSKMPWGVEVPGDNEQVMYVWFDALVNYISALGWPDNEDKFNDYWPAMQVAGKDNLRQQSAMWQAMLMSAGIEPSEQVLIFGFISSDGRKMSKSLGNVVNPFELVDKYGVDAVRYYILADLPVFSDGDFSFEKFEKSYSANLSNGLGNLVSRVSNMCEKNDIQIDLNKEVDKDLFKKLDAKMKEYRFNEAMNVLWSELRWCDEFLSEKRPWKLDDVTEIENILKPVVQKIYDVSVLLESFLPDVSQKVKSVFEQEKITKGEALFPRLQ